MITTLKRSILGLALGAMAAGAFAPGLATHVSAAPAGPTIDVAAKITTTYLDVPIPRAISVQRFTLQITGSGFVPGSKVRIAVMNTSTWELLAKGSTRAQQKFITWVCGHEHQVCSAPNPRAGTIDYQVRLGYAPPASDLTVLYRSAGQVGFHDVKLQ